MDLRLIEAGFPCHQVGAETQREQSVGLQPPVNRLHVWWARRPLTPSRAAILASLLPAATDPDTFVRQLGIERVQALVHGEPWTLTGKLLERIERRDGAEVLPIDAVVLRTYRTEQENRTLNAGLVGHLAERGQETALDPVLQRWRSETSLLPEPAPREGAMLSIVRTTGDPAWANDKMAFAAANGVSFPGDAYGDARAFGSAIPFFYVWHRRLDGGTAIWESVFGQTGIRHQIEAAVRQGLKAFAPLRLNPVDEMVASYGKALQVPSAHWPVQDGDDLVSPVKAMNEASRVVWPYSGFARFVALGVYPSDWGCPAGVPEVFGDGGE